jgi:hypothetical protein
MISAYIVLYRNISILLYTAKDTPAWTSAALAGWPISRLDYCNDVIIDRVKDFLWRKLLF